MWLRLLWPLVGVVGGALVYLTEFDMSLGDAFAIFVFGTILGPICPLASALLFATWRLPKGPIIRRFGSRKEPTP